MPSFFWKAHLKAMGLEKNLQKATVTFGSVSEAEELC